MRGIVTFTTDFGPHDPFVGVMKGQALRRCADLQLVDITHDITRHQPAEAGFWLERAARYFPDGTVHVAVVDPGVGTARALVAVSAAAQVFLAPDNGLLGGIARWPGAVTRRIDVEQLADAGIAAKGRTFHGRDLLAPLGAEIASGRLPVESVGDICQAVTAGLVPPPVRHEHGWLGCIVTVDGFGNLFSNLDADLLPDPEPWAVMIRGRRLPTVGTYGEARPGELVALVNSWGLVEIAEVEGHAAGTLGVGRGEPVFLESRLR